MVDFNNFSDNNRSKWWCFFPTTCYGQVWVVSEVRNNNVVKF